MTDRPISRCGDHVYHRPSRETWLVAYDDGEELAWAGWPDGRARTRDCILIYRATPQEHREAVRRWQESSHRDARCDSRRGRVLAMYGLA